MNADELARAVAAEEGPDVIAALDGAPRAGDGTRAFGVTEAMAIAGFLVQCAQLAVQVWQAKQDRALLVAALADSDTLMKAYPRLDPEKRMGLVARILAKMLPESFATPVVPVRSAPPATAGAAAESAAAERRPWIEGYLEGAGSSVAKARDILTRGAAGGPTILAPFADQVWWIVYQRMGWSPGPADGPGLVAVDVPRGFVTDLASVPRYLQGLIPRAGRYGNAAIYHDWLYWEQACTREVADRVFDRAMLDNGVGAVTRNLIWAGVRVFGGSYWNGNTRDKATGIKRVLKRFPDQPTITWEEWRQRPDVFV
ncbi:MAG: DUF1353 domain-containing protein [Hyphomicrobiaceae bacterium]